MLEFFNKYLFGIGVPIILIVAGIYFIFLLKGFHITKIKSIVNVFTRKQTTSGTSPIKALMLALAGTLGVGNIVGVSAAIYLGGFGAVFWMWISAFLAMLLKYAEIVLAIRHRRFDKEGVPHGSAMQYISDYFINIGASSSGKLIAGIFAIFCIVNSLSMGSMIQINAVSTSFYDIFHIKPVISGIILSGLTALIISKGSKRIINITDKLVPLMTLGYVILSLAVIILRRNEIDDALKLIFSDAFSINSTVGGVMGFLLSRGIRYGVMRGLVSNEAGCGTAPSAHATADTKSPVEQGFFGIIEVFVDTILLCTMTALVVILSYSEVAYFGSNFIMMTIGAYSSVLGKWAEYFLAAAVLFFAFATVICWAHYGFECCFYLDKKKRLLLPYTVLYVVCVFLGTIIDAKIIWDIADFSIGAMTLINVVIICLMSREVKKETDEYFNKRSAPK